MLPGARVSGRSRPAGIADCGLLMLRTREDICKAPSSGESRNGSRLAPGLRLDISHPKVPTPLALFGRSLAGVPNARHVWTNEESDDGAVTAVTFEEKDGKMLLVMSKLYPSKQALDNAFKGMEEAMPETFAQLDEFLVARGAGNT